MGMRRVRGCACSGIHAVAGKASGNRGHGNIAERGRVVAPRGDLVQEGACLLSLSSEYPGVECFSLHVCADIGWARVEEETEEVLQYAQTGEQEHDRNRDLLDRPESLTQQEVGGFVGRVDEYESGDPLRAPRRSQPDDGPACTGADQDERSGTEVVEQVAQVIGHAVDGASRRVHG